MTVAAVAISVVIVAVLVGCWVIHVQALNDKIRGLKRTSQAEREELSRMREEKARIERVPLRSKCRCNHDAYVHDNNGCNVQYPFRWACICKATQEQVLYDPEPMRKMLPL